jgi:hypothetical protein
MRANSSDNANPCRSELAREEPEDGAFIQTARVIVYVLREQARSYRGRVLIDYTGAPDAIFFNR